MAVLTLFFQLLVGHAIGDFVLQPAPMSSGKNRNNSASLRSQYGEGFPPWYYWLSAHSLTHAGIVYVITSNVVFALLEFLSHWAIDHLKCERHINLHMDQGLHIAFKILYCALAGAGTLAAQST